MRIRLGRALAPDRIHPLDRHLIVTEHHLIAQFTHRRFRRRYNLRGHRLGGHHTLGGPFANNRRRRGRNERHAG